MADAALLLEGQSAVDILRWASRETHDDVWAHIYANDVPTNALHPQGYPSIGCMPCTSPVAPGEDPRSGRWRGAAKKECGLHVLPPDGDGT